MLGLVQLNILVFMLIIVEVAAKIQNYIKVGLA